MDVRGRAHLQRDPAVADVRGEPAQPRLAVLVERDVVDDPHAVPEPVGAAPLDRLPDRRQPERLAGVEQEFDGEAQLAPGATVGLLEQEPQLDADKDVRGNVEEGLAELRDLLRRFDELAASYSDDTADEFARVQERIDAVDAWSLDQRLDQAMDALRLPPGDVDVSLLSGGERSLTAVAMLCAIFRARPSPFYIMDEVEAWHGALRAAGSWVFTGGLHPASTATVVRVRDGDPIITDGPFVEGKEHLGGLAIVEAEDLDEALGWARRFAAATTLPIEVQPFL